MRAVFEMLGVHDVVAKSLVAEPYNMIRATIDGLKHEAEPPQRRATPRQEGRRHPAEDRRGRTCRVSRPKRPRRGLIMAKTIVVKQIGLPIRRPAVQRATLIGLGLNKMHRTREARHPRSGHGRCDPALVNRGGARLSAPTLPRRATAVVFHSPCSRP